MEGNAMVTPEQISELPRKYAIGKRPLSRVLGWGELTYTRLLEGSVPTPQHEEELLRALNDPIEYMMLLDRAHDAGLVTDLSYERSKKAAQSYLDEDKDADKVMKLLAVARYICVLAKGDITPHALQLLLYYVHGFSFAKLEKPIIEQQPLAADNGPAYGAIDSWFTFERIQEAASAPVDGPDCGLTSQERKLLNSVFKQYGVFSAAKLQEMACSEGPWRKARRRLSDGKSGLDEMPITTKSMRKYFTKGAK